MRLFASSSEPAPRQPDPSSTSAQVPDISLSDYLNR
jgi:hypothetical protein